MRGAGQRLPGRHDVVPAAVRPGRLAGARLRRPGRLACAGPGLGHHLPARADGGRLRGCHRRPAHPPPRRHRAPARLRGGHRVRPGRPDRGRPGPADHRDHDTADRAAARRGILVRRAAGARTGRRAGAAGPGIRRGGPGTARDGPGRVSGQPGRVSGRPRRVSGRPRPAAGCAARAAPRDCPPPRTFSPCGCTAPRPGPRAASSTWSCRCEWATARPCSAPIPWWA